jgi:hypothetical protein
MIAYVASVVLEHLYRGMVRVGAYTTGMNVHLLDRRTALTERYRSW